MNINRYNYEEFFLLYVDKELSAADRNAVDVFVQENPDLQMELFLLQQTIVKTTDVVLDKKDWLYRQADIAALQENLLWYADNELNDFDKTAVEAMLLSDKKALAEWNIIQQTRLQPDLDIAFPDKQSLYRKEAGRVVAFKWWKAAAAAVLLGLVLWTGVSVYKNNFQITNTREALVKESTIKPGQQNPNMPSTDVIVTSGFRKSTATEITTSAAVQKNNAPATEKIKNTFENKYKNNTANAAANITLQKSSTQKPTNNLPAPYFENINNKSGNETAVVNVLNENNNSRNVSGNKHEVVTANLKENKSNAEIAVINTGNTLQNLTGMQVASKTTAGAENNNRYLDADDVKQKRTALGGFLRKAKRVLERTTNVNTGEGLKIAGFEIALK